MKHNEIIFLLISSFVLVVAWISFNIVNKSMSSSTSDMLGIQVQPIDPTFDLTTLDALKQRTVVTPAYQLNQAPTNPSSPTPSPTASQSSQLAPEKIPQSGSKLVTPTPLTPVASSAAR